MPAFFTSIGTWVSRVMDGGALEIVLLIVIIIVALIVFLVLLWVLWKLLVLLGKGILWLINWGMDRYGVWSQERREERLSAPPMVATGWGAPPNIGIGRALVQARKLVGQDAVTIVLVDGDGVSDLCRSLGLTPPGVGTIGITAGGNTILVDASKADFKVLRRLSRALPWRRPADAVVTLVNPDGIPTESIVRSATFARHAGMKMALHFVLPSTSKTAAWQIIDARNKDGDTVCSELAADTMRTWLSGGSREGMTQLAIAQSRELPSALDRALLAAPSSVVDIAALSFGGAGLRAAVAQTVERTRPQAVLGYAMWIGFLIFGFSVALTLLVIFSAIAQTFGLRAAVSNATREAAVPWVAQDVGTIPSAVKVQRVASLSNRLSEYSEFSFLMPLASLTPNHSAPRDLASAFLTGYVLRPLAGALDSRTTRLLQPTDNPVTWMDGAEVIDDWFASWEGLYEDPREVNIRNLFVDAFGGTQASWAEGTDVAIVRAGAEPPPAELGGLDVDSLTELAQSNFLITMQRWAHKVYANGPVASAARRASDSSADWRAQHKALTELRIALQDPSQQWLTSAKDKPDHDFELRILGRALGLSLFGQGNALRAKAEISRVRIDAREAVRLFVLPDVGPIMARSGSSSSKGAAVTMTKEAGAWLAFLDRVAVAGFTDLPKRATETLVGTVTLDVAEVANARNKLRIFDQFASDLPSGLPPSVAQNLLQQLSSELVVGITLAVEQSLRYALVEGVASEQAKSLARVQPAIDDLSAIEDWLQIRQSESEAARVSKVRARVAESVLLASSGVLTEENPVGIYPDPSADGNALVRRYERGVERLKRIFEQYASPFVESASVGSGTAALEWRNMKQDIEGYERGDPDSVLSGLEGMVRAYAEDPVATCDAPRAALTGRDDYLARTLFRFRSDLHYACLQTDLGDSREAYRKLVDYFDRYVEWLWPYAGNEDAPEITPSTLSDFIAEIKASEEDLAKLVDEPFVTDLIENVRFWSLDKSGAATVQFRVDWRTRRAEENLAEHVISFDIEGATVDEQGTYTWRYGAPLAIKIRLAQNSPYRFVGADDPAGLEKILTNEGNGAWLRTFRDLANGIITFKADTFVAVIDERKRKRKKKREINEPPLKLYPLRITARVTHQDGRPMETPSFSKHASYRVGNTTSGDQ